MIFYIYTCNYFIFSILSEELSKFFTDNSIFAVGVFPYYKLLLFL